MRIAVVCVVTVLRGWVYGVSSGVTKLLKVGVGEVRAVRDKSAHKTNPRTLDRQRVNSGDIRAITTVLSILDIRQLVAGGPNGDSIRVPFRSCITRITIKILSGLRKHIGGGDLSLIHI